MNIIQKSTPNFTSGRSGQKPIGIVIHIMEGTLVGTDSWFASTNSQVSAHYGIGKGGEVHQYVAEKDTAWHTGRVDKPTWKHYKSNINPNLYTIGIEHEGKATSAWSLAMKQASATLIREICGRWNIPISRDYIIGHYEINSKKPNCPSANKLVIEELITLAKMTTPPANNQALADGIKKIEEGLAILKKLV
jgi:N-acetylmuramoyl-L-alanine amidase